MLPLPSDMLNAVAYFFPSTSTFPFSAMPLGMFIIFATLLSSRVVANFRLYVFASMLACAFRRSMSVMFQACPDAFSFIAEGSSIARLSISIFLMLPCTMASIASGLQGHWRLKAVGISAIKVIKSFLPNAPCSFTCNVPGLLSSKAFRSIVSLAEASEYGVFSVINGNFNFVESMPIAPVIFETSIPDFSLNAQALIFMSRFGLQ